MQNSVNFSILSIIKPSPIYNFRTFSSPPKETLYQLKITPYSTLSSIPWQPLIYFLSQERWFTYSGHFYKWKYIICGPLWLAFFCKHKVFKFHCCCSIFQYFIPFYWWIIFHWWIYHLLFIPQLMNIWVVFTFWHLWIMML